MVQRNSETMLQVFLKISYSIRDDGVVATLRKIVRAIPSRLASYRARTKFASDYLALRTPEDRFGRIYQEKYWQGSDSVSGSGSSMEYTANLRSQLPALFKRLSIQTVLDAPCGEYNWMKEVVAETTVDYTGGDIVEPLIKELRETYASGTVRFLHLDITKDPLPPADIMICRDCLFHLSFADGLSVLKNFVSSGIPYLLTTTHTNLVGFSNRDILTGDYRLIDLYSEPYNLPRDPLVVIDDWIEPYPERTMCLWTRDQISSALTS